MQFRKYVLLACGVLMSGWAIALDVKPLGQARGYMEQKNVMVDYATGMFQYTLPLAQLQAGDFSLPICLNYTAKGVKVSDFSGMVGYNWNLLAGAVITRVVRGRNDETKGRAYIFEDGRRLTAAEIDEINNLSYDCEVDLYQLVLDGQTVPFYLRGMSNMEATPLVQTDIKIIYHKESPKPYWTVTDAYGREYVFAAVESLGISRESEISTKNYVASYPCSWYPTEIRIPAQDTIRFEYEDGKSLLSLKIDIFSGFPVVDRELVNYYYGQEVTLHPFNFAKYEFDYSDCMKKAIEVWQEESERKYIEEMRKNQKYVMGELIYSISRNIYFEAGWMKNEEYEEKNAYNQALLEYRERVAGLLIDWEKVSVPSKEVIYGLNVLIRQLGTSAAATYVSAAKQYIKACLREVVKSTYSNQYSNMAYFYNPPYLIKVSCGEDSICFGYVRSSANYPVLQQVKSFHRDRLSGQVNLSYDVSYKLLKNVELKGSGDEVSEKWCFDYYHEDKNWERSDCWGYFSDTNIESGEAVKPNCVIRYSLSRITNSQGGKVDLIYEPNVGPNSEVWGGIRLKEIITDSGEGMVDSILYMYPENGKLVFDSVCQRYTVNYGEFMDLIVYPRYRFEGNALLRTGNEGLYYPYVQEVMKGKGMKAYLYSVAPPPCQSRLGSYSWWLSGQLLGTASYDKYNRLVSVTQNRYMATTDYVGDFQGKEFYETPDSSYAFSDSLWQVKAYPYFSNISYNNVQGVLIYDDPGIDSYWIYPDAELQKRKHVAVPVGYQQFYRIYYGGASLLKENREYRYSTPAEVIPGRLDIEHPERIAGYREVKQVVYCYDNPLRLQPTRVETLQPDGSYRCVLNYTAQDIAPGANMMADSMRAHHLLAPILKQQIFTLTSQRDHLVLQDERVTLWHAWPVGSGRQCWLPKENYRWGCQPGRSFSSFPILPVSSVFSYPQSEYRKEQSCDYRMADGKVDLSITTAIDETTLQLYDRPGGRVLLTGMGATVPQLAVVQSRYLELQLMDVLNLRYFLKVIVPELPLDSLPASFREYLVGASYEKMKTFLLSFCEYCWMGGTSDIVWNLRMQVNDNDFGLFVSHFRDVASHPSFFGIFGLVEEITFRFWLFSKADIEDYYLQCKGRLLPEYYEELSALPMASSELEVIEPLTGLYRLWLYVKPDYGLSEVTVEVQHGNGISQTLELPVQPGRHCLLVRDINVVSGMTGRLRVSIPRASAVACAVLVPVGMSFRFSGTDTFGREEITFDESGMGERYVYDSANRLWQIYNTEGDLLRQMSYQFVSP